MNLSESKACIYLLGEKDFNLLCLQLCLLLCKLLETFKEKVEIILNCFSCVGSRDVLASGTNAGSGALL